MAKSHEAIRRGTDRRVPGDQPTGRHTIHMRGRRVRNFDYLELAVHIEERPLRTPRIGIRQNQNSASVTDSNQIGVDTVGGV